MLAVAHPCEVRIRLWCRATFDNLAEAVFLQDQDRTIGLMPFPDESVIDSRFRGQNEYRRTNQSNRHNEPSPAALPRRALGLLSRLGCVSHSARPLE